MYECREVVIAGRLIRFLKGVCPLGYERVLPVR